MADLIPTFGALELHAIRAMFAGRATPDQQIAGMKWILDEVCRRFDSPYIPGIDQTQQGVLLGRHLAGVYIHQMLSPNALKKVQPQAATMPAAPEPPPRPTIVRKRQSK